MGNVTTLKMRFGNTERTFRFSNEEDAKEAEQMVEEERKFNAEQVATSLEEKGKLSAQISDLQAQLAEHDATLKAAKEELERVMDENTQEVLAAEMMEQGEDESEIANAELAESQAEGESPEAEREKEEFLNSIRTNADGSRAVMSMRRMNCVRAVMKMQGVDIPKAWDQKAYDAAFSTLAVKARNFNKKRAEAAKNMFQNRVINGKPTPGAERPEAGDNRSRMLNAMRLRKGGEKNGK